MFEKFIENFESKKIKIIINKKYKIRNKKIDMIFLFCMCMWEICVKKMKLEIEGICLF